MPVWAFLPGCASAPRGIKNALTPIPPVSPRPPAPPEPEAPPVTSLPPAARMPWVNPARCLPVCAMDPSPRLVRVDRNGQPDQRGRHQVLDQIQGPLSALLAAARQAGHAVRIESAFRSYDEQSLLFRRIVEAGRAARPGHSEHQMGTAVDLRLPTGAALAWLAGKAAEFGFALSYPENRQRLTGYRPEPWHIRFVGVEQAQELQQSGMILEELFRARRGLGESGTCADCPDPASRAPCGEVTEAGTCQGNVLSWCYDGALTSVDCSASGQRCGAGPDGRQDCTSAQ